ncbi:MAG: peptidase [Pirellulaceae bacterium]|nr:peptidase [Pirellulaceae bacterium]
MSKPSAESSNVVPSSSAQDVKRREFLKTTAAAATVTAVAPLILNAADKAGTQLPRVGTGEHTYECHHDWGNASLPDGHRYGNASHGVTIDREGLIYITHTGQPGSLFVFDPNGKFIRSMGPEMTTKNVASGHGIDIRLEGNEEFLYLSPANPTMSFTKMTLKGEIVWTRGKTELNADSHLWDENPKLTYRPTNTSFRPDGGYYLGDGYGSGYLFHYDKNDRFVKAIGGPGELNGQFKTPHGQWLDDRDGTPKLVVADRANARLQWFDMNDQHLRTQDGFLFPADIDSKGDLLLVPDLHARITILGNNNVPIVHLGDDLAWREKVLADKFAMRSKRDQWLPGRFVHPHDACFDKDGNIFVVEWVVTGRVTKLVKVG